jgi:hypothetical protein
MLKNNIMSTQTFRHKYNIGDYIYHNTPDGVKGIILDVQYSVRNDRISYNVIFGHEMKDNLWCDELELSEDKTY